jgi:cobalt-zinc-cadmium resistance protein CzcA
MSLDNLVMQNRLAINMQESDLKTTQLQLGLLLQTDSTIFASDPLETKPVLFDTAQWKNNPFITLSKQQQEQAAAETALAKAKMKPDWILGFNNQSLAGWQMLKDRSEVLYNMGNRFSSVTLGMTLPVFSKTQKQKVNAAKANEEVAAASMVATTMGVQSKLDKAWQEYEKYNKAVVYYQQNAIKQSDIIIATANLSYRNGQINYIEWGTLISQAINIKIQYLETLRQLSIAESELHYLLNN